MRHPTALLSLPLACLVGLSRAHGVILAAQGEAASPPSVGFQVNPAIARNCTTINPCQMDATIIRDAEIAANLVGQCGRTELTGNIDVGENIQDALAANAVTRVRSGSDVTVTIHQVNADGAGPYVCDMDETGNSGLVAANLTVTNNIPGSNGLSQAKAQDFNITVAMPTTMKCTGGSTGDICTVRCRNNAVAGPFGGCFAVQQVDTTPKVNTPANIATFDSMDKIMAEVALNQKDLPVAIQANQNAGGSEAQQNLAAVQAILGTPTTVAAPTQTPNVASDGGAATGSGNASGNGNGNGRGRNRGKNNGNANAKRRAVGPGKRFVVVDPEEDDA
ncbi:hypothetical protein OQA88_8562 [Cercophora sp. LCS_1]